jgi:hypothetical protein
LLLREEGLAGVQAGGEFSCFSSSSAPEILPKATTENACLGEHR